jgi:hypothetical protein
MSGVVLEKLTACLSGCQEIPSLFIEPEGSSSCSRKSDIGHYPEPAEFIPHPPTLFLQDPSQYYMYMIMNMADFIALITFCKQSDARVKIISDPYMSTTLLYRVLFAVAKL